MSDFNIKKKGDRLLFLEGRRMSLFVESSYRKSSLTLFKLEFFWDIINI